MKIKTTHTHRAPRLAPPGSPPPPPTLSSTPSNSQAPHDTPKLIEGQLLMTALCCHGVNPSHHAPLVYGVTSCDDSTRKLLAANWISALVYDEVTMAMCRIKARKAASRPDVVKFSVFVLRHNMNV